MLYSTLLRCVLRGDFAVVWFSHDVCMRVRDLLTRMKNVVNSLRSPEEEKEEKKVKEEEENE